MRQVNVAKMPSSKSKQPMTRSLDRHENYSGKLQKRKKLLTQKEDTKGICCQSGRVRNLVVDAVILCLMFESTLDCDGLCIL